MVGLRKIPGEAWRRMDGRGVPDQGGKTSKGAAVASTEK